MVNQRLKVFTLFGHIFYELGNNVKEVHGEGAYLAKRESSLPKKGSGSELGRFS